jgi:hypothetical protein
MGADKRGPSLPHSGHRLPREAKPVPESDPFEPGRSYTRVDPVKVLRRSKRNLLITIVVCGYLAVMSMMNTFWGSGFVLTVSTLTLLWCALSVQKVNRKLWFAKNRKRKR